MMQVNTCGATGRMVDFALPVAWPEYVILSLQGRFHRHVDPGDVLGHPAPQGMGVTPCCAFAPNVLLGYHGISRILKFSQRILLCLLVNPAAANLRLTRLLCRCATRRIPAWKIAGVPAQAVATLPTRRYASANANPQYIPLPG